VSTLRVKSVDPEGTIAENQNLEVEFPELIKLKLT